MLGMSQWTSCSPALQKWHNTRQAFRLAPEKHSSLLWCGGDTNRPGLPRQQQKGGGGVEIHRVLRYLPIPLRNSGQDLQNPSSPLPTSPLKAEFQTIFSPLILFLNPQDQLSQLILRQFHLLLKRTSSDSRESRRLYLTRWGSLRAAI